MFVFSPRCNKEFKLTCQADFGRLRAHTAPLLVELSSAAVLPLRRISHGHYRWSGSIADGCRQWTGVAPTSDLRRRLQVGLGQLYTALDGRCAGGGGGGG